jgi:hypothetical protein
MMDSATAGLRKAYRNFLSELAVQRLHSFSLEHFRRVSAGSDLRLNLGCGSDIRVGSINIDLLSKEADLHLDLRESLPFRDDSVSVIYGEHCFEHRE